MWTLIKRELDDLLWSFLFILILVAVMIVVTCSWMIYNFPNRQPMAIPKVMISELWPVIFAFPLVAAAVGSASMFLDRTRRISTFLATQATSRRQIFAAKIGAGLSAILMFLGSLALTDVVLLRFFPPLLPVDYEPMVRMFLVAFSASLACLAVGMQLGWTQSKLLSAIGTLLVVVMLLSLIVLKGFTYETIAIFLVVAAASFLRTWQKFVSSPI
jgi:ABC-type transport system involved in multi-copper enzyme maturation permease subunit